MGGFEKLVCISHRGVGFGEGLCHTPPDLEINLEKLNLFYLVFVQYKCENNVFEQINELKTSLSPSYL